MPLLLLSACTFSKSKIGLGDMASDDQTLACLTLDFAAVQSQVIGPRCLTCHGAGSGLLNLDGFANVKLHLARIEAAVASQRMPPGRPLLTAERNMLSQWIQQGSPETAVMNVGSNCDEPSIDEPPPLAPTPDVLAPNYNSIRKHVLAAKCIGCHDASSKMDFSSYAAVIKQDKLFENADKGDVEFVEVLVNGEMPMFGAPLSSIEIDVIRQWVLTGRPEFEGGPTLPLPSHKDPEPQPPTAPAEECDVVDFKTVDAAVFQPRCVGCHGNAGGIQLDSFAAVKANTSLVRHMIANDFMPPRKPLEPALKDLVLKWLDQGALEVVSPPVNCLPASSNTTFL